jgi:molybdopterin molybdotransferase
MVTPAEAEKLILESIVPLHREDCALLQAHARVLRSDLAADRDLPPYDRVTMDGYALRSASVAAGVRRFRVEAVQAAGMRAFRLADKPDTCVEVMTGAVLPEGADCVIPYEDAQREGAVVTLSDAAIRTEAWSAVHRRGGDHRAGEPVVRAGTRLTGREIAVAAACGHSVVTVTQMPKIAVVSTGDELVEVDMPVAAHQIRRSNDYALRAALIGAGFHNVTRFHLRDIPHEIEHLLVRIVAEFDAVVVVGGVSKGKFDYIPAQLERQGVRKAFHGIAQRPGKPMWFGVSARHAPVFALPGNPVSCYVCLHRYVIPALDRAMGAAPAERLRVALSAPFSFKSKLAHFVPVRLRSAPTGVLEATPLTTNTSGDFAGLLDTDGFVELPAATPELARGSVVAFWPWSK